MFLDRDGVINRRIPGGYVTRWEDFEFLEGVLESIAQLKNIFGYIFVVSNQQGIGKGLMAAGQLDHIDRMMKEAVRRAGGSIDAAYYSPYLEADRHPDRKPSTGMALKARAEFPAISFSRSVMAGDTLTDMQFGRNLGMINILLSTDPEATKHQSLYDLRFDNLQQFTNHLTQNL